MLCSYRKLHPICVCVCVPRNPFESAPTAGFNNPKVLPLLQTMSSSVQPCRRAWPVGTRLHIDRCRQRTTAPALRTIRTTATHTLHARVPYRSPHPSPMHPLRLSVCVCVCVPRHWFYPAQTARFNRPKFLPLLQTISPFSCPQGCVPIANCPAMGVIQSMLCLCLWQFSAVL